MADDPKPIKVEKTDTGYDVHFKDRIIGVHSDQADNEKSAVSVATKAYQQIIEHNKTRKEREAAK